MEAVPGKGVGARCLLYVWDESCTQPVVAGLHDEAWRVAEMCVKVSARREIGAAGAGVAVLAGHDCPRVRAAVARALGLIGDTEHLPVLEPPLDDAATDVRQAAETARTRMAARLDLPDLGGSPRGRRHLR